MRPEARAWLLLAAAPLGDFYGIAWRGTPADNLRYARNAGHAYVFYQPGMEGEPLADGLGFFIESPELSATPGEKELSLDREYSAAEREYYEGFACRRSRAPFPRNLAQGWHRSPGRFTVVFDWQRQKVIDWAVGRAEREVRRILAANPRMRLAGFAWDEADLHGAFETYLRVPWLGKDIRIPGRWAGPRSCLAIESDGQQYPTYSAGLAAYYKAMLAMARGINPEAAWLVEPYDPYSQWVRPMLRSGDPSLVPSLMMQEGPGLDFAADPRLRAGGRLRPGQLGSTTPSVFGERANRRLAARAALSGGWFNWYGRFGGTGDMPDYQSIREVPARLKLARLIPAWDNRAGVPLGERSWDGETYRSPNSFLGPDVMYSRHPGTDRLVAVFLTRRGHIQLRPGEVAASVRRADSFLREGEEGRSDLALEGASVRATPATRLGEAYVLRLGVQKL